MKILALDMSTKRTGYAYRDKDNNLIYGAIGASSPRVEARIVKMRDEIVKLLAQQKIDKIVVEEVRPDGYNARTGKVLTWLQGIVAVAAYELDKNIEIELIGPSSWRKQLGIKQGRGIKRDEQKKYDIEYANSHAHTNLIYSQDDEADAICILLAQENQKPINDFGGFLQ